MGKIKGAYGKYRYYGDKSVQIVYNTKKSLYTKNCSRNNGVGCYITNPCFELWLLLYFDEVFGLDEEMLLVNPKVTAQRRYTEQELRRLLPGYTKGKYNAETLILKIGEAVRNVGRFCQKNELLKELLGS